MCDFNKLMIMFLIKNEKKNRPGHRFLTKCCDKWVQNIALQIELLLEKVIKSFIIFFILSTTIIIGMVLYSFCKIMHNN